MAGSTSYGGASTAGPRDLQRSRSLDRAGWPCSCSSAAMPAQTMRHRHRRCCPDRCAKCITSPWNASEARQMFW